MAAALLSNSFGTHWFRLGLYPYRVLVMFIFLGSARALFVLSGYSFFTYELFFTFFHLRLLRLKRLFPDDLVYPLIFVFFTTGLRPCTSCLESLSCTGFVVNFLYL